MAPIALSRDHIHINGVRVLAMGIYNAEWKASPGVAFLPYSYGRPIRLEISFGILEGTAVGNVAPFPLVILVCRGQGRPR